MSVLATEALADLLAFHRGSAVIGTSVIDVLMKGLLATTI